MKPMQWLGVAIAAVGAVLMSCSDRLFSVSVDRFVNLRIEQHIHLHWCLLIGIAIVLGGGLPAQVYQPPWPASS